MQVFVSNIPYRATEDDIRKIFEDENIDVLNVRILMEGDKSKGYGFVDLPDHENVESVVEKMNQVQLMGRTIYVEKARGVQKRQTRQN